MGIPIGQTVAVAKRGIQLNEAFCEHCQAEFVYAVARAGGGAGTSLMFLDNEGAGDRATARAEADLKKRLAKEIDPVPCPSCNLYQADMAKLVRDQQYGNLKGLVALCSLVAVFCVVTLTLFLTGELRGISANVQVMLGIGTGAAVISTIAFLVIYLAKKKAFDPNLDYYKSKRLDCKQPRLLLEQFKQEGPDRLVAFANKTFADKDREIAQGDIQVKVFAGVIIVIGACYFYFFRK